MRAATLYGASAVYSPTIISTPTLATPVTNLDFGGIWVTSITVTWKALPTAAQAGSSSSAQGYLLQAVADNPDFTAALAGSSATNNVSLSTLTIPNLGGGTTYYFRVGSRNWAGVYNYSVVVSTLLPIQFGVVLSTHALTIPGLMNMNYELVITTSIIITNTGNVAETFWLRATTTTLNSPWKIGAAQGLDYRQGPKGYVVGGNSPGRDGAYDDFHAQIHYSISSSRPLRVRREDELDHGLRRDAWRSRAKKAVNFSVPRKSKMWTSRPTFMPA